MAIPKERQAIVRSQNHKKGTITFHMQNRQHHLPAYDSLKIDGLRVSVRYKNTDTVTSFPDIEAGYELAFADKFEIVFKKVV